MDHIFGPWIHNSLLSNRLVFFLFDLSNVVNPYLNYLVQESLCQWINTIPQWIKNPGSEYTEWIHTQVG